MQREDYLKQVNEIPKLYSDPHLIYRSDIFKKRGFSKDPRWISDLAAQKLIENDPCIDVILSQIPMKSRGELSYSKASRDAVYEKKSNSRLEEVIAMWLRASSLYANYYFPVLGKVVDYQVPIKTEKTDPYGKIDLISYDEESNNLFLVELKAPGSPESINRAILEISTYEKIIDHKKLKADFSIPANAEIVKMVLVHEKSSVCADYSKYKATLADKLNVMVMSYTIGDLSNAPKTMPQSDSFAVKSLCIPFER